MNLLAEFQTLSKFFFIYQLMHNWIVLKSNFKIYIEIDIKAGKIV
jgi:hypothetical protein